MPVTASYRAFVMERLQLALPDVRARDMFGGVGIYSGTTFFALIGNDVLYFKVDDHTRASYESRALREWASGAVTVGRRAKQRKAKRGG